MNESENLKAQEQVLETDAEDWDWEQERETIPETWRQIWARRAARLAEKAEDEETDELIELALVELGCEVYGLDVHYVFDIRPLKQITSVPRVPEWVSGVVNLRGRIYSVIDLTRFFGLSRDNGDGAEQAQTPYLVIVETADMEVALLVDNVLTVDVIPASQIQDAADTVRGIRSEYVRGVATYNIEMAGKEDAALNAKEEPMLVVLDLPALLADEKLVIHEEIV